MLGRRKKIDPHPDTGLEWRGDAKAVENALILAAQGKRIPLRQARHALAAYYRGIELLDGAPNESEFQTLKALIELWDEGLPPPTMGEIAARAEVHHTSATWHLDSLERMGCVRRAKKGWRKHRPTQHGRKVLEMYMGDCEKKEKNAVECIKQDTKI